MTALLLLLYGPHADALGDRRHAAREAATAALTAAWPLSEPAVRRAEASDDAEARGRAGRVRAAQLGRWGRVPALLLGQSWTADEARAAALLLDPHESDGLPWASDAMHDRWADMRLRRSLVRVAHKLRLVAPDEAVECDPDAGEMFPIRGRIPGLDDLRFAVRGLPGPATFWHHDGEAVNSPDSVRELWAARKAGTE